MGCVEGMGVESMVWLAIGLVVVVECVRDRSGAVKHTHGRWDYSQLHEVAQVADRLRQRLEGVVLQPQAGQLRQPANLLRLCLRRVCFGG